MNKFVASFRRPLVALTLAAAAVLPSQAETAVPVEDFSVFVDMQTGFAFVKTPAGWRFVRQIEAGKLALLHPTTLVAVMQAGERFGRVDARAERAGTSQPMF